MSTIWKVPGIPEILPPMADAIKELEAMKTALAALEDLDPEGRARALNWLASALNVNLKTTKTGTAEEEDPGNGGGGHAGVDPTVDDPKAFLANKNPETDIERIACLAYYLSKHNDQRTFSTKDLTELNLSAAGRQIGNPSQAAADAVRKRGFLAAAGGGRRQITRVGEEVVEALPDREKVKAVTDKIPRKKRRKAKAKKAKK